MQTKQAVKGIATALTMIVTSWAAHASTVVSQTFPSPTLGRDWVYNVYLPVRHASHV